MNPELKAALITWAASLTVIADSMRAGVTSPGITFRESEGLTVLSAELDAVVEGIGNLNKMGKLNA